MLNVDDLANMLAGGDVTVNKAAARLTFRSGHVILRELRISACKSRQFSIDCINKPVVVTGTGAITITTNDGGSGGDFGFLKKGHIEFWDLASSLVINGKNMVLVNDIATLASDIANNQSGY